MTVENLRDTIQSHFDGNDVLSDELLKASVELGILGTMGKELRGSIFIHPN